MYCYGMLKHQKADVATKLARGEAVSVGEAATYFGVSSQTIHKWVHKGRLRALMLDRTKWSIRADDLLGFEQRVQSMPPAPTSKPVPPPAPVELPSIYPEGAYDGRGWGDDVA